MVVIGGVFDVAKNLVKIAKNLVIIQFDTMYLSCRHIT